MLSQITVQNRVVVNGLDPGFPSKKLRVRRREVPWRPNPGSRVGLNRGRQRPQSEEGWTLKPVGLGSRWPPPLPAAVLSALSRAAPLSPPWSPLAPPQGGCIYSQKAKKPVFWEQDGGNEVLGRESREEGRRARSPERTVAARTWRAALDGRLLRAAGTRGAPARIQH